MAMTPEARAARAKYMREWRKKNPEKQREYDAKKWERKGQQIRAEREAANNGNEQVQN
ncbi:MAG: hypothetical protein IKZ86_08330 [Spirochaetaceae bacterium]|nr:hypothetical protein [Spirochaetaceae bacterium]